MHSLPLHPAHSFSLQLRPDHVDGWSPAVAWGWVVHSFFLLPCLLLWALLAPPNDMLKP